MRGSLWDDRMNLEKNGGADAVASGQTEREAEDTAGIPTDPADSMTSPAGMAFQKFVEEETQLQ